MIEYWIWATPLLLVAMLLMGIAAVRSFARRTGFCAHEKVVPHPRNTFCKAWRPAPKDAP